MNINEILSKLMYCIFVNDEVTHNYLLTIRVIG